MQVATRSHAARETLSAKPLVAHELTADSLNNLATRQIGLIHVRNFFSLDPAFKENLVNRLINHPLLGHYRRKYTSGVARVGTPHIDAEWDGDAAAQYHRQAIDSIHQLRGLFSPNITPIDRVRLMLQELWPKGANLQQLHGRSCFVGAVRVFKPDSSEFYPHHDRLEEESDAPEAGGLADQMVANVYLTTSPVGGDLELWLREANDDERVQICSDEGLSRRRVEEPALTVHPEAGDLTIFCSRMLHAVTPSRGAYRVGMAAFIGCRGPEHPLTYWS